MRSRTPTKRWRPSSSKPGGAKASDEFNAAIAGITDPKDKGEWQAAMRAFGQTIWGTTAWGRQLDAQGKRTQAGGREWRTTKDLPPSGRRPIVDVLKKTAEEVAPLLEHLCDVGERTTKFTTQAAITAAKATAADLSDLSVTNLTKMAVGGLVGRIVLAFRSHMDKSGCDAVVETYHKEFTEAADKLKALLPELEIAIKSAPTYQAELARAQGFGARSLNEFKKEHRWQTSVPHEGPLNGPAWTGRTIEVDKDTSTIAPARDTRGVTSHLKYDPNLNPPFVVYTSTPQ
ncbi:hypothetical protein ACFWJT_33470 [Streptomyces sp. NPDC127069]|uniref:hypothetical protein n=1 Tax=Streptomyces sp. NPDC127069 TaxID=3347128 RepID=UPI00365931AB